MEIGKRKGVAMSDSCEIRTMRLICWERAKGELNAMLQTFWGDRYDALDNACEVFVKKVEDEGLNE